MVLNRLNPRKAINKAFLKVKPSREDIEHFKSGLIQLIDRTNDTESEEFNKNLLIDFLKFPIPASQDANIDELVRKIQFIKTDNPESDTSSLETEIDQLVYKLYNLTEEEIGLVEESVG